MSQDKENVLVIAIFDKDANSLAGMIHIFGRNMKPGKIMIPWQVATAMSGIWWRLGDVQKLQV